MKELNLAIILFFSIGSVCIAMKRREDEKRLLFRNLLPKDMGAFHNEIVMQVHDRILEVKPTDHDEYSRIIYEEVITTCEATDDVCRERVWQNIEKSKVDVKTFMEAGESFDVHSLIHDDLDPELKLPLHEILDTVYLLHDHPLDHVVERLNEISDSMENGYDEYNFHKEAVQMVSSIASGSALLWSEVEHDPENAFHKLYSHGKKRNLQTLATEVVEDSFGVSTTTNIVGFVLSDTIGAVKGIAIPVIFFLSGLGEPSMAVENAVQQAMIDSLLAIGIRVPTVSDVVLCAMGVSLSSCDFYNF